MNEEATQEVVSYFQNDDVRHEIKRILHLLANQPDPRLLDKTAGLIVDPIEHDAPGWYRVKVPRYALRIIFRLLVVRGERILELTTDEMPAEDDEKYIDITRIGRHPNVYGQALRQRFQKLKGDKH